MIPNILASNPIFESYFQSDLFGKAIFLALLALSVVTWVIFAKKWRLQRALLLQAEEIEALFEKRKNQPLALELPPTPHPFFEVYQMVRRQARDLLNKNRQATPPEVAAALSSSDINLIEAALGTTISQQVKLLEKNLFVLSTVVSLAPFLGLLGTVWGILVTFAGLTQGSMGSAHSIVMNGLAMALGTTIVGLLVAIPALVAYNYLKATINRFATDTEDFSKRLLVSLEMHYRKVE